MFPAKTQISCLGGSTNPAVTIVLGRHRGPSWQATAARFGSPCPFRRGTIHSLFPTWPAPFAPQFHGWLPTPQLVHCLLRLPRCCHASRTPLRCVCLHPVPARGRAWPRLRRPDAPRPEEYPPCTARPVLGEALPLVQKLAAQQATKQERTARVVS